MWIQISTPAVYLNHSVNLLTHHTRERNVSVNKWLIKYELNDDRKKLLNNNRGGQINDYCNYVVNRLKMLTINKIMIWRRICSLDTRGDSALEVLRNRAL